jgi:hypothetical protein
MQRIFDNFDKYLKVYFLAGIILLSLSLILTYQKIRKIENLLATVTTTQPASEPGKKEIQRIDICGEDCQKQISEQVSKAVATISGTTTKEVIKEVPTTQNKTSYIPLTGPITTTSLDWIDAAGTDVYIDLANDYNKNAYVTWEAFLKVANGNGMAYARLYDVTHGIAVNGSEISTDAASSTQIFSGKLSLWAGKNLYRVQLRSLTSFEVTFSSGRIKIVY